SKRKNVFDAKATKVALLHEGIELRGIDFDLMLAAYLINPAEKNDEIAPIARRTRVSQLQYDEEVYGKGAKRAVPEFPVLAEHIARKTNAMYQLQHHFMDELEKNDVTSLFTDLELPLAEILAEMEHQGVQLDVDRLKNMGEELTGRLNQMEHDIHEMAGETFNINSPKQLAVILFEKLKLPVIKKTKTGYSTAADVLEKLRPEHDMIPKLL